MGTRSTIRILEDSPDGNGVLICTLYNQYDGYIDGVGADLADFIQTGTLTNGIPDNEHKYFNGLGCFIAQYIKEHKTRAGGLYIVRDDVYGEYNYLVKVVDGEILMSILEYEDELGFVPPSEFVKLASALEQREYDDGDIDDIAIEELYSEEVEFNDYIDYSNLLADLVLSQRSVLNQPDTPSEAVIYPKILSFVDGFPGNGYELDRDESFINDEVVHFVYSQQFSSGNESNPDGDWTVIYITFDRHNECFVLMEVEQG